MLIHALSKTLVTIPPVPLSPPAATQLHNLLQETPGLLTALKAYKGCSEGIRQAISSPSLTTELAVWKQLSPGIQDLVKFYETSSKLEEAFKPLITFLCSPSSQVQSLVESYPYSVKLIADALLFAHIFDELKVESRLYTT